MRGDAHHTAIRALPWPLSDRFKAEEAWPATDAVLTSSDRRVANHRSPFCTSTGGRAARFIVDGP